MLFKGDKYDKKRFIIDIIIISFSFLLSFLAGAIIYYPDIKDRAIQDILDNWNSTLITDIKEKGRTCLDDYTELHYDRWNGTIEGCNCLGRSGSSINHEYRDKVLPFPCTNELLEIQCYRVTQVLPRNLNIWQTRTLCLKRTADNFYTYHQSSVKEKIPCPSGMTQCGTLDTMKNKLCITGTACPINKIMISSFIVPNDYTYTKLEMTPSHFLFFTNGGVNEVVPNELTISEGNVCVDPNERNIKFEPYVLDRIKTDLTCSLYKKETKYDTRYVKLDSITTRELYDQNGILTPLMYLPQYPKERLDAVTSLYSRTYLGWDLDCRLTPGKSPEDFQKIPGIINDLKGLNLAFFVLVILSFIYLLIITLGYKQQNPTQLIYLNITSGISMIFFLAIFIIGIVSFIIISQINLGICSCGDPVTSLFLSSLYSRLLFMVISYLIIGICFLFASISYVVLFIMSIIAYNNSLKNPQSLKIPSETHKEISPIDNISDKEIYNQPIDFDTRKPGDEGNDLMSKKDHNVLHNNLVDPDKSGNPSKTDDRTDVRFGGRRRNLEENDSTRDKNDKWNKYNKGRSEKNIVEYK